MCLAVPGEIIRVQGEGFERAAKVSFGGTLKEASLAYVPEAKAGDYVIVHAGFAISVMDPAEAGRVFEYLEKIGELEELRRNSENPAP